MNHITTYIKTGLSLAVSYFLVVLFSGAIFLGNSPTLRPHPEQYIADKMEGQVSTLLANLNFGKKANSNITANDYKQFISTAAANSMKEVTKGTYAASIKGENVRIVKLGEKDMDICVYATPDGPKQVKILKGKVCPTKEEVMELIQ